MEGRKEGRKDKRGSIEREKKTVKERGADNEREEVNRERKYSSEQNINLQFLHKQQFT